MTKKEPVVSVIMPCLNEEETIGVCIKKVQNVFAKENIDGEIVICDNGSTDKSASIAKGLGANVVYEPLRGYGNAYLKGFSHAKGKYLIMADSDDTYDFNEIPNFLDKLVNGKYDFVTGSRYLKGAKNKCIPVLNRYFGNPILTAILNTFFGTRYTDVYCGFRGFSQTAYEYIKPVTRGMEFNLELAINAKLAGLKITEIPIHLHPRKGQSKLRAFRDGWRSLRMMLLYCPNKVFILPGGLLFLMGISIHLVALSGLIKYHGRSLGNVTGIFGTILTVVGFEIINLGLHVKTYSWARRFERNNKLLADFYKIFKLEIGLVLGVAMVLAGGLILTYLINKWFVSDLLPLQQPELVSFAATLVILGFSVIFSSLFISSMSIKNG